MFPLLTVETQAAAAAANDDDQSEVGADRPTQTDQSQIRIFLLWFSVMNYCETDTNSAKKCVLLQCG